MRRSTRAGCCTSRTAGSPAGSTTTPTARWRTRTAPCTRSSRQSRTARRPKRPSKSSNGEPDPEAEPKLEPAPEPEPEPESEPEPEPSRSPTQSPSQSPSPSPARARARAGARTRAAQARDQAEVPAFVEYSPSGLRNYLLAAVLVLAAVAAVLTLFLAAAEPTLGGLVLVTCLGLIAAAAGWALASWHPTIVAVREGVLTVSRGSSEDEVDLRDPQTQVDLGAEPGSSGWRATVVGADGRQLVIGARQVKATHFSQVVRHYRATQGTSDPTSPPSHQPARDHRDDRGQQARRLGCGKRALIAPRRKDLTRLTHSCAPRYRSVVVHLDAGRAVCLTARRLGWSFVSSSADPRTTRCSVPTRGASCSNSSGLRAPAPGSGGIGARPPRP